MLQEMIDFALEIRALIDSGMTLREVCAYSYRQRESGRNVPYLRLNESGGNLEDYISLLAVPTVKQPELFAFFNEPAPGCKHLSKYTLAVLPGKGVIFLERTGRGSVKQNTIDILAAYVSGLQKESAAYNTNQ